MTDEDVCTYPCLGVQTNTIQGLFLIKLNAFQSNFYFTNTTTVTHHAIIIIMNTITIITYTIRIPLPRPLRNGGVLVHLVPLLGFLYVELLSLFLPLIHLLVTHAYD